MMPETRAAMDSNTDATLLAIRLSPARLISATTLLAIAGGAIGFLAGYFSMPGQHHRQAAVIGALASSVAMAILVIIQISLQKNKMVLPCITLTPGTLTLPSSQWARKTVNIPIEQVRSANMLGKGWYARLVIDAGRRFHVFPVKRLPAADTAEQLQTALKGALLQRPDGQALWAAMDRRHHLAADLGRLRPMGTWAAAGAIAAIFCLQCLAQPPDDVLGPLDLGANAPILVGHGQWFRLVTASLLHANLQHLLGNTISLLVIGTMVERLAGLRHSLIILLTACLVSQGVSAAAGAWSLSHICSVGISGGIFGLFGALGAIAINFRSEVPAGYRIPGRNWLFLILVYAVVYPMLVPQIDSWAHAGGALAGFATAWLLCRVRPGLDSLKRPTWLTNDALAALLIVFGVGVGAQLFHATSTGAHFADRIVLAEGIARRPFISPAIRNAIAWQAVTEPGSPPRLLQWSAILASQAVRQYRKANPKSWDTANAADTEAMVAYRLGEHLRAVRIQAELPWLTQPYGSHLALFLDGLMRDGGQHVLGDSGPPAPTITLGDGVLHLTQAAPAPNGARLYAVLRDRHGLAGVLFFRLPPGFSGTQILPLPASKGAPATTAPPPIWFDSATSITVALFDRRGCACQWPAMGPNYAAYIPDPSVQP
jgi:membrane associated rhomboid family serine protease